MDWRPTPKQAEALRSDAFEVLLGGARGGGKTDCGLAWFLYMIPFSEARGLCIRRNSIDLVDWIDRARVFYAKNGAEVVGNPPEIHFPTGAIVRTGHLKDENAYEKYQGHEYHRMLIEELTQIPREDSYQKLIASCRSASPRLRPQIFATTNPGGPGHKWVQQRFRLVGAPRDPIIFEAAGRKRAFFPARLLDNPHLTAIDPKYSRMLDELPDGLREAWRDGSWDSFHIEGAFYTKELEQMRVENRITNVPWEPKVPVQTFWDLGMRGSRSAGNYMTILFVQFVSKETRIIDAFQNHNEGIPYYVKVLKERPYAYSAHWFPFDVNLHEMSSNRTRADAFRDLGIEVSETKTAPTVADGIQAVRLLFPKLWIDKTKCAQFLDALAQYRQDWDEHNNRFRDTPVHDWSSDHADALRGLALTHEHATWTPSSEQVWKIHQNRKRAPRFR